MSRYPAVRAVPARAILAGQVLARVRLIRANRAVAASGMTVRLPTVR
jgi:hypothetical protein